MEDVSRAGPGKRHPIARAPGAIRARQRIVRPAAPRPRWRTLYPGVAVTLATAVVSRLATSDAELGRALDAGAGLLTFAYLFRWIRANAAVLQRGVEPPHRPCRSVLRVVRSRDPAHPSPTQEAGPFGTPLLPYDFR